jgi:long-chain acyl-CoA synthetase
MSGTFAGFLIDRFREAGGERAVASPAGSCTFDELAELVRSWGRELEREGVEAGTVTGLAADFSPNAIGLFLALVDRGAIVAPGNNRGGDEARKREKIAEVEALFHVDRDDAVRFSSTGHAATHGLYGELRRRRHPGLVLFSSGTSGEPKAALHDFTFLLDRYRAGRRACPTLAFLLFEHGGGINTMLHGLANGATIVSTHDRSPEAVCALIERERVELLPATPSFFNLLLLSGAHRRHDLSSLRIITYGAEPMAQTTLDRLRAAFPAVKVRQTYGLIELWAPRAKARDEGSLWLKLAGDGYEARVVDGVLQVRTDTTIMGYLNAPTPITADGWFVTGDAVLQDGEYLRIVGRESELINVGGEKVYPAEVEGEIESVDGVAEATVYGEPNPIVGQIVCARVTALEADDGDGLGRAVKRHCRERLERFKVPVKVEVVTGERRGERVKKSRRLGGRQA